MGIPLRLLLVEDSEDDALLLKRTLTRGGYELMQFTRVDTAEALENALAANTWDIIIADYAMPQFDGIKALEICKAYDLEIPFIIVSGTIGETVAVNAMKAGAHDYLMKDKLARLIPAIERELEDAAARRARRAAEEEVRKLSRAVEQSPIIVIITNTEGDIEYVNPVFTDLLGYSQEEALNQGPDWLRTLSITAEQYDNATAAFQREKYWRGEMQIRRKDGSLIWLDTTMTPIRDKAGRATHILSLSRDITESKQAQRALEESEARFRQLVENAADALFVVDYDGHIVNVNQQACASLGYTQQELLARTAIDVDASVDSVELFREVSFQGTRTFTSRHLRKDGTTFPVEVRLGQLEQDGKTYVLALARDITEREKFNEALQLYNEQLEELVEERTSQLRYSMEQMGAILESSSDAIALAASNGDITTSNPAFRQLVGHGVSSAIEEIVYLVAQQDHMEAMTVALFNVLHSGMSSRVEVRIENATQEIIDVDIALTSVQDQEGDLAGVVLSLRDITHLKEIDRLKSRFIANAAHDLANPIANLKLHLYALKGAPDRLERYMPALESQTRRMEGLVQDLRVLSQLDRGVAQFAPQTLDLHQMLDEVVIAQEPLARQKDQRLIFTPCDQRPIVMADQQKMDRVVVNLVANAMNYTPEGGEITVTTVCDDSHVSFSVQDTGIGISADDLERIFDRFFRSDQAKLKGIEGTGLGLSIVKEIIEAHQGTVAVQSTPGDGSCFTVRLPLADQD
jgi:PAS domain S-box-containing protein